MRRWLELEPQREAREPPQPPPRALSLDPPRDSRLGGRAAHDAPCCSLLIANPTAMISPDQQQQQQLQQPNHVVATIENLPPEGSGGGGGGGRSCISAPPSSSVRQKIRKVFNR